MSTTPPVPSHKEIKETLKDLIMNSRESLKNMYGRTEEELNKGLEAPIERGVEMARKLITDMGCDREAAKDLTVLTLYNVALLIDDSDSIIREEGGMRKKTLIEFVDRITEICSMANESGIFAMRFMNSKGGKKNWTERQSKDYLGDHSYGSVTRIGTELKRKILDKFVIGNPNQNKPLLVLIVTDGAAEGERNGHLKKVIQDCMKECEKSGKGRDAVSFQFSRIGNDAGAAQLLMDLDQDPDLGDYIDTLPVEFTVEFDHDRQLKNKWFILPKILIGAILHHWDNRDDHDHNEVPNAPDENANPRPDWADSNSD